MPKNWLWQTPSLPPPLPSFSLCNALLQDGAAKAILAKASLTSVLFELVRSDPWETVMRAGVSGMAASVSSNEAVVGAWSVAVFVAVNVCFFCLV